MPAHPDLPGNLPADLETPVSAYLKLAPLRPRFLLESAGRAGARARHSFLGFGPTDEWHLEGDRLRRNGEALPLVAGRDAVLGALRRALAEAPRLADAGAPLPFRGGLVGALAYGLARRLGLASPGTGGETDDGFRLLAPHRMLVFDHATHRVTLLCAGGEAELAEIRAEVLALLAGPTPAARGARRCSRPRPGLDRAGFLARVARVREAILDGEVYQLVLSCAFHGTTDLAPLELYRALRMENPSPYMTLLEFEDLAIVGASPEALVRADGRHAALQPIAGTRPRGRDAEADRRLEAELLADEKEAAEHVMLVDLARNDLGRRAVPGSVRVGPYRSVERFSHVMHLVSEVSGTLAEDADVFDCLADCFPAGTVVGAPKRRAMELLDALEPEPRGFYGGTVGTFGHDGTMDQALTIRTLLLAGGRYRYQAGAGIVAGSCPEAEHDEILAKGAALARALERAAGGLS